MERLAWVRGKALLATAVMALSRHNFFFLVGDANYAPFLCPAEVTAAGAAEGGVIPASPNHIRSGPSCCAKLARQGKEGPNATS
jgi:hypothetical protein